MHEDSIKFFLSSTDKGAVGFIPAQELAILTALGQHQADRTQA